MHLRLPIAIAAAALPLLGAVWQASAADRDRGMVLYEARCVACHTTSVHNRDNRKAKSYAEVREWVTRWSNFLGSDWGPAEIEDVTRYVNDRFYNFSCPVDVCRVGT